MKLNKKENKILLEKEKEQHPKIQCEIDQDLLNRALKILFEKKFKKLGILSQDKQLKTTNGIKKEATNLMISYLELECLSLNGKIKKIKEYLSNNVSESSLIVFKESIAKSKRNYKKGLKEALVNDMLENLMINYMEEIEKKEA